LQAAPPLGPRACRYRLRGFLRIGCSGIPRCEVWEGFETSGLTTFNKLPAARHRRARRTERVEASDQAIQREDQNRLRSAVALVVRYNVAQNVAQNGSHRSILTEIFAISY
jgi:hypothetical protein